MSSDKNLFRIAVLVLGSLAMSAVAGAQDPQPPPQPESQQQEDASPAGKPKPAARGIPAMSDPNATVEGQSRNQNWQADDGPATGMQVPGLGAPELGHSYWVPGLEYGSTIQSRPLGQQQSNGGWYANNYVGGELSLLQVWSRSQFGLNYSGGGFFSTSNELTNGTYQQVSLGDTINWSRMQLQFFDYFSYIPDSQFGFAGGTALAIPGITGTLGPAIPGLGAAIVPNQSIYAAIGPRYSNAFAAQGTYSFSRRSSITFGGSYGLLHFTQSGNIDNDMTIGTVGYNYALSPTDSLGVLYRFSGFHYDGEPQALGNHVINVVYLKKITERLALNLFGGPQITMYRVPVNNSTRNTSGSGGVTLNYAVERGAISASYFHGLTGGAGIFLGSNTDQATVSVTRVLGRVWTANVNFGYARNAALGSIVQGTSTQAFHDWFAGGGVSRPFGRNVNLSVAYSARFESSNAGCAGIGCSTDYTQNMVSVSLQWHTRPFVLP